MLRVDGGGSIYRLKMLRFRGGLDNILRVLRFMSI